MSLHEVSIRSGLPVAITTCCSSCRIAAAAAVGTVAAAHFGAVLHHDGKRCIAHWRHIGLEDQLMCRSCTLGGQMCLYQCCLQPLSGGTDSEDLALYCRAIGIYTKMEPNIRQHNCLLKSEWDNLSISHVP
jgi:hypothetical protein